MAAFDPRCLLPQCRATVKAMVVVCWIPQAWPLTVMGEMLSATSSGQNTE